MYNSLMQESFNASAGSYDHFSPVQEKMAHHLACVLKDRPTVFPRVFEIGCGTGHFSAHIMNDLRPDYVVFNDISRNMLDRCRMKIGAAAAKVTYLEADFEEHLFQETYDGIFSNAVFQWFKSLPEVLERIHRGLTEGGTLAFTTLVHGTFCEMQQAFAKAYADENRPYRHHTLEFCREQDMAQSLQNAGFTLEYGSVTDEVAYFSHPLHFFKGVKAIGAAGFHKDVVSYATMKRMLAHYQKLFAAADGRVPATYRIGTYIAQKVS
jgi:malonyl-CoA O-methyltransferase